MAPLIAQFKVIQDNPPDMTMLTALPPVLFIFSPDGTVETQHVPADKREILATGIRMNLQLSMCMDGASIFGFTGVGLHSSRNNAFLDRESADLPFLWEMRAGQKGESMRAMAWRVHPGTFEGGDRMGKSWVLELMLLANRPETSLRHQNLTREPTKLMSMGGSLLPRNPGHGGKGKQKARRITKNVNASADEPAALDSTAEDSFTYVDASGQTLDYSRDDYKPPFDTAAPGAADKVRRCCFVGGPRGEGCGLG